MGIVTEWRVAIVFEPVEADSPKAAAEKIVETLGVPGRTWCEVLPRRREDGDVRYLVTVFGDNRPVSVRPLKRGEKGWT